MRRLVALLVLAAACAGEPARQPTLRKSHLGRLPSGVAPGSVAVAEDATEWAYVAGHEGAQQVVWRGRAGARFIRAGGLVFSPKPHRPFYWGLEEGPPRRIVLMAGEERLPGEFGASGRFTFSKDGTSWAVLAERDERMVVVVDGRELGRHVAATVPAFSPDGRHVAWIGREDDGRLRLLVDGEERASGRMPVGPCQPPIEASRNVLTPRFTAQWLADGRLVTLLPDERGWHVRVDGEAIASYTLGVQGTWGGVVPPDECRRETALLPQSVRLAERAPAVAWWERIPGDAERWRVVRDARPVDDVVCESYWEAQPPELTPDGRHLAYACQLLAPPEMGGIGVQIVRDGVRHGLHRSVWGFGLGDDGRHVSYGGSDDVPGRPWRFFVDGEPRSARYQAVWRPRLSPDGAAVAWQAELDSRDPAILGIERMRLGTFDEILWGPFWEGQRVAWVIRRGRRVVRVEGSARHARRSG